MKLWVIRWKEAGHKGTIEVITPLFKRKGEAILWLLEQRPYLIRQLGTLQVIPYIHQRR